MIDERPLISGVGIVPEEKYFCTDFAKQLVREKNTIMYFN